MYSTYQPNENQDQQPTQLQYENIAPPIQHQQQQRQASAQPISVSGMTETGMISDFDFLDVFQFSDQECYDEYDDGDVTDEETESTDTKMFHDEMFLKQSDLLEAHQPLKEYEQPQQQQFEPIVQTQEITPLSDKILNSLIESIPVHVKIEQQEMTQPFPIMPTQADWVSEQSLTPPVKATKKRNVRKRKALRPSPGESPAMTAVPVLRKDANNVDPSVLSAAETKIPSIRKTNTSLEIFEQFVTKTVLPDGTEMVDASGILSSPCFDLWLQTRRKPPKNPYEAFRKTLVARITVADERSLPFAPDVEKSLLVKLRKRQVWPCFQGRFTAAGKPILIGSNGLRAIGFHERASKSIAPIASKKRQLAAPAFQPAKKAFRVI